MRIAAIFSAVRNNKPSKSSYQEIIDQDDESWASTSTSLIPNGLTRTNNCKYLAVLIFAVAFVVLVVCLSFEGNTVRFASNENIVLAATEDPELEDVVVVLNQGSVRGKRGQTRDGREYLGFFGIPYAKPPLGDLRFQVNKILFRKY